MKFNKLKDESGSAMLLAIFLVVLVSIVIISFSTQVGNQIKSTMRADENIQKKYDMESYIEEAIANFIGDLKIILRDEDSEIVKKEKWKKQENNQEIEYDQEIRYIYYEIYYQREKIIELNNEKIIEIKAKQISPKESTDKNPLKIFSHTSPEAKQLDIKEFNGIKKEMIIFQIDITERNDESKSDDDIKSTINIKLSNLKGEKNKETCNITYEVKSWRIK